MLDPIRGAPWRADEKMDLDLLLTQIDAVHIRPGYSRSNSSSSSTAACTTTTTTTVIGGPNDAVSSSSIVTTTSRSILRRSSDTTTTDNNGSARNSNTSDYDTLGSGSGGFKDGIGDVSSNNANDTLNPDQCQDNIVASSPIITLTASSSFSERRQQHQQQQKQQLQQRRHSNNDQHPRVQHLPPQPRPPPPKSLSISPGPFPVANTSPLSPYRNSISSNSSSGVSSVGGGGSSSGVAAGVGYFPNETKVSKTVRHSIQYGLSSTLPHLQHRALLNQQQQNLSQQKLLQHQVGVHTSNDRSSSSSSSGRSSSIGSSSGGGGGSRQGHIIGFNSLCSYCPRPVVSTPIQRCHSQHHLPNLYRSSQQHAHKPPLSPGHLQPPLLATQYAAPVMHFMQPSPGSRGVRRMSLPPACPPCAMVWV
ncbi:LOW QUALITY PROTEIN: hypothetical protein ElyMa_004158000 [Elysia marginata]|uniref:Uncharacterized protein n=1 Tax=Elysia marginata TaxID=1093978 RepID=A0AAV4GH69_9GAST|nr:LOW QUALITY PROTEIN: hypothetical protein ElyMa_004158000 [Elysia marginata]